MVGGGLDGMGWWMGWVGGVVVVVLIIG